MRDSLSRITQVKLECTRPEDPKHCMGKPGLNYTGKVSATPSTTGLRHAAALPSRQLPCEP